SPWWPGGKPVVVARRQWLAPVQASLPGGNDFPALVALDPKTGLPSGPTFLAADADGDGIADAGLVKLPIGAIDGITYYVGVRIVDNAAAVNAAVAWEPNPASDISAGLPGDFFPTNIDLRDLLTDPAEVDRLNAYRFGGRRPNPVPWADAVTAGGVQVVAAPRSDFRFTSAYD